MLHPIATLRVVRVEYLPEGVVIVGIASKPPFHFFRRGDTVHTGIVKAFHDGLAVTSTAVYRVEDAENLMENSMDSTNTKAKNDTGSLADLTKDLHEAVNDPKRCLVMVDMLDLTEEVLKAGSIEFSGCISGHHISPLNLFVASYSLLKQAAEDIALPDVEMLEIAFGAVVTRVLKKAHAAAK